MITHHVSKGTIAYPNDLALLKRIYDRVCMERGFLAGSPQAADLASRAMDVFGQGIFDEEDLLDVLRREN